MQALDALKTHLPFLRSECEQILKRVRRRYLAVTTSVSGASDKMEQLKGDGTKLGVVRCFINEIVKLVCSRIEKDLENIQMHFRNDSPEKLALCRQIIDQVFVCRSSGRHFN